VPDSGGTVVLRRGRERSVINRHPWVFSGSIQRAECPDGQTANVYAADGAWLARGYYNSKSQIRVRLLTWDEAEAIDEEFWYHRLRQAIESRLALPERNVTAMRLVNAESDRLPGLIVDLYVGCSDAADRGRVAVAVVQFLTLGAEGLRCLLGPMLERLLGREIREAFGGWDELLVYDRSDMDVRRLEGLQPLSGPLVGGMPPQWITVEEHGFSFLVDVVHGHKTGHYLDQRLNRVRVAQYCSGAEVLNAFSYTGGFGVHALGEGAQAVIDVDTSQEALALGRRNVAINGLPADRRTEVVGDVFQVLRRLRDEGRRFDVVVLDPPKFAFSKKQIASACRGYKDINLLAMQVLRPGGILATFSCSGLVSRELFQKVLFGAAVDAGRDVQVLEVLGQAPDHPVSLTFPESEYLKGFICRIH